MALRAKDGRRSEAETPAVGTYRTKQEWIYESLRSAIANRLLRPGQRLVIEDIRQRFGASGSPVREALARLAMDGLVEIVPHAGATVKEYTPHMVEMHWRMRGALEGLIASIVAVRITDGELAHLHDLNRRIAGALTDRDAERWADLNVEFHAEVRNLSREPELIAAATSMRHGGPRFRHFPGVFEGERGMEEVEEHQQLIERLGARDAVGAAEAVRRHFDRAGTALRRVIEEAASPAGGSSRKSTTG